MQYHKAVSHCLTASLEWPTPRTESRQNGFDWPDNRGASRNALAIEIRVFYAGKQCTLELHITFGPLGSRYRRRARPRRRSEPRRDRCRRRCRRRSCRGWGRRRCWRGCRTHCSGAVSPASVQKAATPDDHFTARLVPYCRVISSASGGVGGAGGCPTIRAGIVPPAGI